MGCGISKTSTAVDQAPKSTPEHKQISNDLQKDDKKNRQLAAKQHTDRGGSPAQLLRLEERDSQRQYKQNGGHLQSQKQTPEQENNVFTHGNKINQQEDNKLRQQKVNEQKTHVQEPTKQVIEKQEQQFQHQHEVVNQLAKNRESGRDAKIPVVTNEKKPRQKEEKKSTKQAPEKGELQQQHKEVKQSATKNQTTRQEAKRLAVGENKDRHQEEKEKKLTQSEEETYREYSASPYDPSVKIDSYRNKPLPVFGTEAFPLSKGTGPMTIEDTFWPDKRALIPNYGDMERLDRHAIEAPQELRNNADKLVKYLTKPAKTDLEKFRTIFRWEAHNIKYDAHFLNTGIRKDNTPEGVLRSGVAVCEGYSKLLVHLCEKSGLECEYLTGHSKGTGYEPGLKDLSKLNHAWNRITLNGRRYFCDCTWAAGNCGPKNGQMVFTRTWQEHQFLAEPQSFTGRHLSSDLNNQDCPSPYKSVEQWNTEPHRQFPSAVAGITCLTHKNGIIEVSTNEVLIKLKSKRALYRTYCRLESENGTLYPNYVQHWWNKDVVSCLIKPPKAGKFTFAFLGRFDNEQYWNKEVQYPNRLMDVVRNRFVTYVVKATGNGKVEPMSVGEHSHETGAPVSLPEVGLIPLTENSEYIKAPKGKAYVIFRKHNRGPALIQPELYSLKDQNKKLGSCVYLERFEEWVVCHVRCPAAGRYILLLHVKGLNEASSSNVRYTIFSEGEVKPVEFPIMHGNTGPTANFYSVGLRLAETLSTTINTVDGDGELILKWDTNRNVEVRIDLKNATGTKSLQEEGHAIVESQRGECVSKTTISIRLKEKGLFDLSIFAKDSGTPDRIFVGKWLVVCNKPSPKPLYPTKACHLGQNSNFQTFGLETRTQDRILMESGEGSVEVYSEAGSDVVFLYNIRQADTDLQLGMVFADSFVEGKRRVSRFEFRMDKTGTFAFRLFAKKDTGSDSKYECVGVWLLCNDKKCTKPLFPQSRQRVYGSNSFFRECGLLIDESVSKRLILPDGEGTLSFRHKPGTRCNIMARLETTKGAYEKTRTSTLIETQWTNSEYMLSTQIRFRIPDTGFFNVMVFAENRTKGSNDYAGVWLVECVKGTTKPLFPDNHGSMGPQALFHEMGLSVVRPLCSTISATEGVCQLTIQRDKAFSTSFNVYRDKGSNVNCVVSSEDGKQNGKHTVTCTVRLPKPGLYGLNLWAADSGQTSKPFVGRWLLEW